MVSSTALNSQGNNFPCLLLCFILCLLLQILNQHGGFVLHLVLQGLQQLLLRFLAGQAGQTLQLSLLLRAQLLRSFLSCVQALLLAGQLFFLTLKGFDLTVQIFFLLYQATLLTLQITASIFIFALHFRTQTMDFLFSLHHHFFAFCLANLFSLLHNADCLFFGGCNLAFGYIFTYQIAHCTTCQANYYGSTNNC